MMGQGGRLTLLHIPPHRREMHCKLPQQCKLPCVCLCHVVHAAAAFVLAWTVTPDPVCCFKGCGLQGGKARIVRRRRRKGLGRWGAGLLGARDEPFFLRDAEEEKTRLDQTFFFFLG